VVLKLISVANWLLTVLFDAVGWVIWPVKIVYKMTYSVSNRMLNLNSLTVIIIIVVIYLVWQQML